MFEKAIVRGAGISDHVDIGVLAETLLFYSAVHLHLNRGALSALLTELGVDTTLRLLNTPGVTASYIQDNFGVISTGNPGMRFDQFVAIRAGGKPKASAEEEIEEVTARALKGELTGAPLRKATSQITKKIAKFRFSEGLGVTSIIEAARQDVAREDLSTQAAKIVIEALMPDVRLTDEFHFNLIYSEKEGYLADTNINALNLDKKYAEHFPPSHSSLTSAYVLSFILNARADAFFAAEYMGELVTGSVHSQLIRKKHFDFIRRRDRSEFDLTGFQDVTLKNARAIREAIGERRKTFSEFLDLLDRARRFKGWLTAQNPDETLLSNYLDEVQRDSWIDKLPPKALRFVTATGLGVLADRLAPGGAGTLIGLGLGATDTFFLDRILRGWRPNQFVERKLLPFVSGE